jgi:hypothetical protein
MRYLPALSVLALLGNASIEAKECKGVTFPDQIDVDGTTLTLNGLGLRQATAFKVSVYVAGLYLPTSSADADAILSSSTPKALVMQFVRNVGVNDLRRAWNEGFEKNAKAELGELKGRIETFNGWMSDVKTGQNLVLLYKPGTGIDVNVNGAARGTIEGDDFARALFAIWLGDPPNPEIKAGLLGAPCK